MSLNGLFWNFAFDFLIHEDILADIPRLDVPLTREQMSHQIILDTDKSKDEVYDLSLEWMAKTFVS